MKDEYKEAYTMLCAAAHFAKESQKFKLPPGMAPHVSHIIEQIEELKLQLKEEQ